ncbi:hypothetical protein D6745_00085 [Candidatus Woesearchaeota archaeon]|nr:MAG: hypothetical protein D6745_00085 [Candidatus Woesearchaeota archaeon]
MLWLIFALGSAFFAAAASIIQKKALIKEHAMEFSAVLALINAVISLFLLPFVDFNISTMNLLWVYLASWLGTVAFLHTARAIRHMQISLASPMLNFGPAFSAILAAFILGEKLVLYQWLGIILLVIGAYVLEIDHKFSDLIEPFRRIKSSKYIHFIFFALLLYGFSSIIDRYVVTHGVSPISYIFFAHIFIAINFFVLLNVMYDGVKGIIHGLSKMGIPILLVSLFTLTYRFFQIKAVSMTFLALVVSIKRTSTILATLIGGELFHEEGLILKLVACAIMVVGAVLVAI